MFKLIVISGHPGSGKTTLAKELSKHFNYTILERDDFKKHLIEMGVEKVSSNLNLGALSFELFFQTLNFFLNFKEGSVIAVSNFDNNMGQTFFSPWVNSENCKALEIHCYAKPETLINRFQNRAFSKERMKYHEDIKRIEEFKVKLALPSSPIGIFNKTVLFDSEVTIGKEKIDELIKNLAE